MKNGLFKKKLSKTLKIAVVCSGLLSLNVNAQIPADIEFDNFDQMGGYAFALRSMTEVKQALSHGAVVSAAIDLTKCSLSTGKDSQNAAGGLKIENYLIDRDGNLKFASYRTTASTRSGSARAVHQVNRYTASDDGDISFTSYVFTVPDYVLTSQVSVDCKLNESFRFYTAF